MYAKALSLPAVVLFLLLCGCNAPALCGDPREGAKGDSEPIWLAGRIAFVPLEGGFFGVIGIDGEQYDPVDLPESFRQDGLRVRIKARPIPRTVGVHMWGRKIEIISIEKL